MLTIKILSVFALTGSIVWLIAEPNYEPALAVIVSMSTLIANFVVEKQKNVGPVQHQTISDDSVGIQAGGNVTVGDIRTSPEGKPNAE